MTHVRLFFAFALAFLVLTGYSSADEDAPRRLVDAPTAGTLLFRQYSLESQMFDGGGLTQRVSVGLNRYVTAGFSWGGSNIIGAERVVWQPHVGIQVRVRLAEETMRTPAFAIGFDSQGEGPWLPGTDLNRFRNKSRGVYAVLSRNYRFFGNLGFHGGANYSLETDDGDYDPSFWAGFDKDLGEFFDICGEYDFATNDNERRHMTANHGYLNTAIKWHFGKIFALEFDLRNILRNPRKDFDGITVDHPEPSREVRFSYTSMF